MSAESELIERNLQTIESAVFAIAKDLNWFTPTQIKDIPNKPGWKRIASSPTVLPDAKEHQLTMDNGLGFALAQVCYGKKERILDVFLKAMRHVGLTPENYEHFAAEFQQFYRNFSFETDANEETGG